MPDTPSRIAPDVTTQPAADEAQQPIRRKRGLRIALVSFAAVIVLLGAVVAGGFAYLNHVVGAIPRIPVNFTTLKTADTAGGMTVLLTGYQVGPTGSASRDATEGQSDLIMLLHINAGQKAGGVVSIPPTTEVNVSGRGRMPLSDTLTTGGPSLLVQAVQTLTGVPINHYARIDFAHTAAVVNALGGVTVTMSSATTAFGHEFHPGVNYLNGVTAVDYTRQFSLTEQERVQRRQSLMRAMLTKLAQEHLLTNPVTMVRVLNSITKALTVDSDFSNSQIVSLATKLGKLGASSSTFVTAPVTTMGSTMTLDQPAASQLWTAINQDSIATYAQQHPATITPAVVK